VKGSKGSEPHSPRQWVGGERGDGVEQDDRKSGGSLHVRPLRSMYILYTCKQICSIESDCLSCILSKRSQNLVDSVENSPTV
jgi:hypothetical protein